MAKTKRKISKLKEEARKLFALETTVLRSVSLLTLAALGGTLYFMMPVFPAEGSLTRTHFIFLGILALFLAVNFFQQRLLMRLRRKWMELEEQSSHDGLTGAFNRESFEEILEEEMSRADRYKFPLTLCIVDLDNFKYYNDTFGHPQGDRLLKEFAERVHNAIRTADCLARYGGDEFCILLPHTSLTNAEKFLSRILPETQEWLDSTFSAGMTSYRAGEDKISFITRADQALYQAKREGKNQIRCQIGEDDREMVVPF